MASDQLISAGAVPRLVSVVVPCFNTHAFITRTLASVAAQTHPELEIIVVDDGSDNPETIAALDHLPSGARLIRQANRGLPGARNAGIEAARGAFILPLDSDDWIAPDTIEKLHRALTGTSGAMAAFADMQMEHGASGVLSKEFNYFEQLFFNQLPYCMLYRKADWAAIGGYDETMRRGYEDWDFNIRLCRTGVAVRVDEPLFHYRVSDSGMLISQSNRAHVELWQTIQHKNADLYRATSLVRLWRQWRTSPSTYPLVLHIAWYGLTRLLPIGLSNRLFALLRKGSQSRRVSHLDRLGRRRREAENENV